jgi:hypothetical protein
MGQQHWYPHAHGGQLASSQQHGDGLSISAVTSVAVVVDREERCMLGNRTFSQWFRDAHVRLRVVITPSPPSLRRLTEDQDRN